VRCIAIILIRQRRCFAKSGSCRVSCRAVRPRGGSLVQMLNTRRISPFSPSILWHEFFRRVFAAELAAVPAAVLCSRRTTHTNEPEDHAVIADQTLWRLVAATKWSFDLDIYMTCWSGGYLMNLCFCWFWLSSSSNRSCWWSEGTVHGAAKTPVLYTVATLAFQRSLWKRSVVFIVSAWTKGTLQDNSVLSSILRYCVGGKITAP
jgi:hypothetical protein